MFMVVGLFKKWQAPFNLVGTADLYWWQVIELSTVEQQTQLVCKIEPYVLTVVKDTNGNHVR